jgi:hypothetical protein
MTACNAIFLTMEMMLFALAIAAGVAVLDAAVIAAILNLPASAGVQLSLVVAAVLVFWLWRQLVPRPASSLLLFLSDALKVNGMGDPFAGDRFAGHPFLDHPSGSGLDNLLLRTIDDLKEMQPRAARADSTLAGRAGLGFSIVLIAVAVGLLLNAGTFGHVGVGWLSALLHR